MAPEVAAVGAAGAVGAAVIGGIIYAENKKDDSTAHNATNTANDNASQNADKANQNNQQSGTISNGGAMPPDNQPPEDPKDDKDQNSNDQSKWKSGSRQNGLQNNVPENNAGSEKLKNDLASQQDKPIVQDKLLQHYMDEYYRPEAKVGNGNTADAVRYESETGQAVGGKFHSQKASDAITNLSRWLNNNPNAAATDRAAAQNTIRDLANSLKGK